MTSQLIEANRPAHGRLARVATCLCVTLITACSSLTADLERSLRRGQAIEGEIHGAYPALDLYVLTYRAPDNFFEFVEVSLVAPNASLGAQLASLRRHDRVRIAGELMDNRSSQLHVELRSLEVLERYEPSPAIPAHTYSLVVPEALEGRGEAIFLVHAVHEDGRVLVVEHGDVVLPVFVQRPELARDLARNDVIRLAYDLRAYPDRPVHLEPAAIDAPIEVLDSIMSLHGRPAEVEGPLVLFPQSPQVRFNVFAVLDELPGGQRRQYTLVNFEDPDTFAAIRDKLQRAWDAAPPGTTVSGRNKLVSAAVRVRATGTFNQIDPGQANAQIVLDSPDALEIETE